MKRSEALKQITEIIIYGRTEFTSDKLAEIILTQLEAMGMDPPPCRDNAVHEVMKFPEGISFCFPRWEPEDQPQ